MGQSISSALTEQEKRVIERLRFGLPLPMEMAAEMLECDESMVLSRMDMVCKIAGIAFVYEPPIGGHA